MTRNDWYISASLGTFPVGAIYAAWLTASETQDRALQGALAIGVCYVLSMFAYMIRLFCRVPRESPLFSTPIRSGTWLAFLGGIAYGACVVIGVTLAYWYAARPTWDSITVIYTLFAQLTTIFVCSIAMIPVGFLAGVIYSLYNRKRAKPSGEPEPQAGRFLRQG